MPVVTVRGRSMYYRTEGAGPYLLLLPGQTSSSSSYPGEIAYFARQFTVIAPDLAGTGLSERVKAFGVDYWDEAARDMVALVGALGMERLGILGCSGGGVVGTILAAALPDRVAALVLDSTPEWATAKDLENILEHRKRDWDEVVPFWEKAHGDDWERVIRADTDFLRALADGGGFVLGNWLERVECPSLFVAGLKDELMPRCAEDALRMAARVPRGRAHILNDGGHPVMWGCPEEFRGVVGQFLGRWLATG